jgi:hypothetical protein
VQPYDEDEEKGNHFFLFLQVMEHWWKWNWQGNIEVLGEKPVPVPLCPPQIPHGLTWNWTRNSAAGSRRLTAWAMVRPFVFCLSLSQSNK